MLDHHLQRGIIHKLAFMPEATFTELKPAEVDNKLFTYHLKKTVIEDFVTKNQDGQYSLTAKGRRLSTGVLEKHNALIVERPLSVLFLVIRRSVDNAWLMYERKTHPMLGYKGFMHCRPNAGSESVSEIARDEVLKKTRLLSEFSPLGGGYVRTFKGSELESYINFTLLYCDDITGELIQNDTHAEYLFESNPDFVSTKYFPTTMLLKQLYEAKKPFFVEETYSI